MSRGPESWADMVWSSCWSSEDPLYLHQGRLSHTCCQYVQLFLRLVCIHIVGVTVGWGFSIVQLIGKNLVNNLAAALIGQWRRRDAAEVGHSHSSTWNHLRRDVEPSGSRFWWPRLHSASTTNRRFAALIDGWVGVTHSMNWTGGGGSSFNDKPTCGSYAAVWCSVSSRIQTVDKNDGAQRLSRDFRPSCMLSGSRSDHVLHTLQPTCQPKSGTILTLSNSQSSSWWRVTDDGFICWCSEQENQKHVNMWLILKHLEQTWCLSDTLTAGWRSSQVQCQTLRPL